MRISLESTSRRLWFTALLLLVLAGIWFEAGRLGLAWVLAHSSDPADWLRAVVLEPGNAEYWHRLGEAEQWNFQRDHLRQAVVYYQRAAQVNPHSALYWIDLGGSLEMLGEFDGARNAFEQAKICQPQSGEVAWRYGNFLLRRQAVSAASVELHRAVIADPDLTASVVAECWSAGLSVDLLLKQILPPKSSAYLLAMNYFVRRKQTAPALTLWNDLLKLSQPFELAQIIALIDELLAQDRIEDADRVWRQALSATGTQSDGEAAIGPSLVFDGGFERPIVNGGFGWRQLMDAGASIALDTVVFHSGHQSLRIAFDGSANVDFSHFLQVVRVLPSERYRLSAYIKTQELSTDSGIRLQLSDFRHPAALRMLTDDLVGTHSWTHIEQEFVTTPETNLLAITLRRIPTWKFDNKLRGSVWVDDVSLGPVPDQPQENRQ